MSVVGGTHSVALDPDAQRVIEERRARRLDRLATRDRATLFVSLGLFLAVAGALVVLIPSERDRPRLRRSPCCSAPMRSRSVSISRSSSGSAVPTQLILVPMLFVLPIGSVPLAVAARDPLREHARVRARLAPPGACLPTPVSNAWHSVGPALVLGIAGRVGSESQPLARVHGCAAGAVCASTTPARRFASGPRWACRRKIHLRAMASVYVIDLGLAPIGLAVAFAAVQSPAGVLLALPLVALLAVFARERRVRIDHELELRDAYRGTAFLLGDVVEADDEYTGTHSRDVVDLTLAVVDEARPVLDRAPRRRVRRAAPRRRQGAGPERDHQQARASSPPRSARSSSSTRSTASRCCSRVGGLLGEIGEIVRACHERWDGTGYPDGVAGEEIPLIARIVAAATRSTR